MTKTAKEAIEIIKKSIEGDTPKEKSPSIEPKLNWDQKKAIELEAAGKLPELARMLKKQGRDEQGKRIVEEIQEEEREKARRKVEEELNRYNKAQKEYDKTKNEDNVLYQLRMEVISLLAQRGGRREATEQIVKYIEKKENIYSTRDDLKSEMWIYHEGIYIPQGKSYIQESCREILKENFTTQICNEVISKIEADTLIDIDKFFKTNYIDEIPVENGILNIRSKQISEFNPKKVFFNKLPIKYNPNAECPHITQFFKDVLKHEEDTEVMFELFGYCLLKEYKFEKAFMFVGNGRNGKSKTLSLLKRFVGAENCCSVPLSQINPTSTSVCELYGRLVNLAGDLSNTDLKDTGTIKQITGRDLINAKRKFLRDLIFVNYAKLVFACNDLPRVYDTSEGFWSRWLLLEFPYKFITKKEMRYLTEKEKSICKIRDEDIIEKITTPEEMSGLLNKALKKLESLEMRHNFSYSKGTKEIKDMWVRQADSFMAFCLDHVKEDYNGKVTKKNMRRYFSKYCKKHQVKGASDRGIKATLENNYGVIEAQLGDYGRERVWEGITLIKLEEIEN